MSTEAECEDATWARASLMFNTGEGSELWSVVWVAVVCLAPSGRTVQFLISFMNQRDHRAFAFTAHWLSSDTILLFLIGHLHGGKLGPVLLSRRLRSVYPGKFSCSHHSS